MRAAPTCWLGNPANVDRRHALSMVGRRFAEMDENRIGHWGHSPALHGTDLGKLYKKGIHKKLNVDIIRYISIAYIIIYIYQKVKRIVL